MGTDRKQFNMFFEKMMDGFAYSKILVDDAGKPVDFVFLEVNDAFERLTGLKKEKVLGKKATEVLTGAEADVAEWISAFGEVALTAKSVQFERFARPLGKWYNVSAYSPEKDYFVALFEDITERKGAEEQVRSVALFPSENPYPVFRVAKEGTVTYSNSAGLPLLDKWKSGVGQSAPENWRRIVLGVLSSGIAKQVDETYGEKTFSFAFVPIAESGYVNIYGRDITERKKAEGALEKEKTILTGIMENSGVCLAYLDTDFNFVAVNSAYAEGSGHTASALVGKNHFALFPNEENQAIFQKVRDTGEPVTYFDKPFEFADQPERGVTYWDWSLASVKDAAGHIQGLVLSLINTTKRVKAQQAFAQTQLELLRAKKKYRRLFETSKDGIVARDLEGRMIECNQAYARTIGYSEEELKNLSIKQLLPEKWHEQREKIVKEVLEESGSIVFEREYLRKDGTTFPASVMSWRLTDEEGKIIGIWSIVRDITDQKKAEEALITSVSRFKLLSETTSQLLASEHPQAIVNDLCTDVMKHLKCDCFFNFLTDETRGKLKLNAYAGIPEEEAARTEWLDYGVAVCGCVAQTAKRIVAEDVQNTADVRTELVKSYGIQAYACHPLLAQGKVIGTLSFGTKNRSKFTEEEIELMRIVTDQVSIAMQRVINQNELRKFAANMEELAKQRADQLKNAERLATIGATAGMVGHDIRNPLQAMIGDLYLAKMDLASCPEGESKLHVQESLEAIEKNAEYINKIVTDLQDYAKPLNPALEEVDLDTTIRDIIRRSVLPKNIKPKITVDSKTRTLMTDPNYLRRVLGNLVSNAFQAMPNGGALKVHARRDAEDMVITVEDTGLGIPEEAKAKLFTPLFTTKSKGQGFGLAVVKRLTEALNGTVTFESKEGKGTKFIVRLPQKK